MLHVHRAERADVLTGALADLLVQPLADPLVVEVVAVPTHGMERWLTQRLSTRLGAVAGGADGVCANVEFPSPARIVNDAMAAAMDLDAASDLWTTQRSLWPLLEVVDACIIDREAWALPLVRHLGADADPRTADRSRRLNTVRHIAGLFWRYAMERPAMLLGWADGRDEDADGRPLEPVRSWQAELWRRLRARIGQPSLAERLVFACARLREDASIAPLPERLSFFGLNRLPAAHLEVLRALAENRDVHLFLLQPSPASWSQIAAAVAGHGPVHRRAAALDVPLPDNQLVASWGRDARELQLLLAASGPFNEHHHPVSAVGSTLLARLQADVRADRSPPATFESRPVLGLDDHSVQVHACHGRARQVEVLRDAILHALADDPTLEPRDIIVMCPDIDTFAPLIQATFGTSGTFDEDAADRPAADLRVRLADRSLRQTNPLLGLAARLLELADARLTASDVLDLVDREPVRRRFGFDDDDITRLEEWVAASGARWGLDAEHRGAYDMSHVAQGTWHVGLDRLMLGAAMAGDGVRLFGEVLPIDDVESDSIELAGCFAELMERLGTALDMLAAPQSLQAWLDALTAATDALAATSPRDTWQRSEMQRLLADLAETAAPIDVMLDLADVHSLLADRLAGRPTRANFRTGHLTACTLVPMRSVPHRVVCLLGLDDSVFPRHAARDGDDILLEDPHVGDHDPRSEGRQILLDALLAASDRLIITYTGRDERTNASLPPAVVVSELLDVIERTVQLDDVDGAILIRHPLQPFDGDNFITGELVRGSSWSFDTTALEGARSLAGERGARPPFLGTPLAQLPPVALDLDDLVEFVAHPVRAFFRQRLGIFPTGRAAEIDDALLIDLDGLARWAVGDRLLTACLAGIGMDEAITAERARGGLPPGRVAELVLQKIRPEVAAVHARAQGEGFTEAPVPVDVRIELPAGRVLTGTVAGVAGDVLQTVTYSRVSPDRRLAAWVRLLALTSNNPELPYNAMTIGRGRARDQGSQVTVARIPLLGGSSGTAEQRQAFAMDHLVDLVALYDRGMTEPLPVYAKTSAAYASGDRNARKLAEEQWVGEWDGRANERRRGECKIEEHVRLLGEDLPFDALFDEAPRDDEVGERWDEDESSRFGRYARRWWRELPRRERLSDR